MPIEEFVFFILLFLVAAVYSSVGHGGASGYLAIMAIYNFTPDFIRPTALLLNLFVSMVAFVQFYRKGFFNLKIFLPLALTSIPFAFIGGMIPIETGLYKILLGIFLLIAAIRLAFFSDLITDSVKKFHLPTALLIGGIIGFISGILGIGGGVILSPVILLLSWANQKQAAAISALFIFVNSLSGLAAQLSVGNIWQSSMFWSVGVAFSGGLIGSYYGAHVFAPKTVKLVLAVVLVMASVKLICF
ncbi:MAG: sulfite exporter TauE/SafE family protein [Bacteroidetes bacterium]|nr:sulfite exporter TauE/SafE family protein [Bacteroidota bacterium]